MKVTVIKGVFSGKDRMCYTVIGVTPDNLSVEQILRHGVSRQMFRRIPEHYTAEEYRDFSYLAQFNDNVILLVIPK